MLIVSEVIFNSKIPDTTVITAIKRTPEALDQNCVLSAARRSIEIFSTVLNFINLEEKTFQKMIDEEVNSKILLLAVKHLQECSENHIRCLLEQEEMSPTDLFKVAIEKKISLSNETLRIFIDKHVDALIITQYYTRTDTQITVEFALALVEALWFDRISRKIKIPKFLQEIPQEVCQQVAVTLLKKKDLSCMPQTFIDSLHVYSLINDRYVNDQEINGNLSVSAQCANFQKCGESLTPDTLQTYFENLIHSSEIRKHQRYFQDLSAKVELTESVLKGLIANIETPFVSEFLFRNLQPKHLEAAICYNCPRLLYRCFFAGLIPSEELVRKALSSELPKEAICFCIRCACLSSKFVTSALEHQQDQEVVTALLDSQEAQALKKNPFLALEGVEGIRFAYLHCAPVELIMDLVEKLPSNSTSDLLSWVLLNRSGNEEAFHKILTNLRTKGVKISSDSFDELSLIIEKNDFLIIKPFLPSSLSSTQFITLVEALIIYKDVRIETFYQLRVPTLSREEKYSFLIFISNYLSRSKMEDLDYLANQNWDGFYFVKLIKFVLRGSAFYLTDEELLSGIDGRVYYAAIGEPFPTLDQRHWNLIEKLLEDGDLGYSGSERFNAQASLLVCLLKKIQRPKRLDAKVARRVVENCVGKVDKLVFKFIHYLYGRHKLSNFTYVIWDDYTVYQTRIIEGRVQDMYTVNSNSSRSEFVDLFHRANQEKRIDGYRCPMDIPQFAKTVDSFYSDAKLTCDFIFSHYDWGYERIKQNSTCSLL